ncbi:hypothetical protein ABKN59_010074 [Abortiporus biennis]
MWAWPERSHDYNLHPDHHASLDSTSARAANWRLVPRVYQPSTFFIFMPLSKSYNFLIQSSLLSHSPTAKMCELECFGNYHRKCSHYVKLYESGSKRDCGSPWCALSKMHMHKQPTRKCTCAKEYGEERRVVSLIHDRCETCKQAAWASLEIEPRW